MGVAGSEVVEGGEIDAALSVRGVAGRSAKVPAGPAGGLSMAPSNSTRRRASSVRSQDMQGRLLIAPGMYLICSASDGIEGPGRDPAIKGSLVELASFFSSSQFHGSSLALRDCIEGPAPPFYPSGSVIEFKITSAMPIPPSCWRLREPSTASSWLSS
ncbi:hypothetical protein B9Z19DRAFT_1101608 [Tuber borchii]|uniref:Uncharacterized protein n=1 Tax=Tuber borchii TaxID=42251 RepID=A0A2T6ZR79_TUBBO|nr:hypothetical protein B9Z19DRAFT_1101608 [Tuber borchii]